MDVQLLQETVVLGLLLGVSSAFVVVVGLNQIHWSYRAALPIALAWLLLPTRAYPASVYFLLTSGESLAVLALARWWHRRRNSDDPSPETPTFSLRSLLTGTGLIAGICGLGVIAVRDTGDVVSQIGSSLASSGMILVATWCCLTKTKTLGRLVILVVVLVTCTVVWNSTHWFDLYELRISANTFGPTYPAGLVLSYTVFGGILALCTAVVIKAFHDRSAEMVWTTWTVRCVAIPLIAVAGTLGSFFYYRLARPLPIPAADLPNPNGHTYFAQAGESLRSVRVPEPEDPSYTPATMAQFVTDQRAALSLVRKGLKVDSQTVLVWDETDLNMDAISDARQVGRALRAEALVHTESEQHAQAAQSCVDCIRFAHAMSRGGLNVHWLTASAIEGTGSQQLHGLLPLLDRLSCRAATTQLLRVDEERELLSEFERRDELWSQATYGWLIRFELAMRDLFHREPASWPLLGALEKRNDAIRRLLIVELALREFTIEHEAPPNRLDSLVPTYLPNVPRDPFDNAPLRYRIDGVDVVVYSIGPDLDDDLGKALTWEESTSAGDGDIVLDRIFDDSD